MYIPGMHLVASHSSPVHGRAIYIRDPSAIVNCCDLSADGLETLQNETTKMKVISVYNPPSAWLSKLLKTCVTTIEGPKVWKKTVALLRPEKDPKSPKNYRPISINYHMTKQLLQRPST